ncbi:YtcA family lipoprotein [Escherichia coli]|uniref:YtcA family lipoprotein n=1 Tax=Escherichia coli TaxID=562 RepID=UPI003465E97B
MPTVLSRMAMQLKKTAWIIPVFMVSGCSLSPAIPVIGAYYPSWFFCAIASLILMLITRRVIQRANINLAFVGIIGNDSNLLIVFYVQIMPDDFVMQLHRF